MDSVTFEKLANRLIELREVSIGAMAGKTVFTFTERGGKVSVRVNGSITDKKYIYKSRAEFVRALKRGIHWGAWQSSAFGKEEGYYPQLLSKM